MSKQTTGKTLLRNVIRQTDALNKIQEESEMWKMRGREVQRSHSKHLSECVRGDMHCDRELDQPRDLNRSKERISEHDDRDTRYWTRKLYEFEANDPDRWGHSGFKELYPEEFDSDNEKNSTSKKTGCHKMKKSKSDTEASLVKRSKKTTRKKKKKKKKKDVEEKRKKAKCLSSGDSSDDSSATRAKQRRRRTKGRHKNKKPVKIRERAEDSSSVDSDDDGGERERRTHRGKKRKQDPHKDSDSGQDSKKKRRKNWKAAGEESSDDSSAE
uniref:NKAP domain containing 1 n=2 Tax=Monopterus albus TaxID=43700 RepID=A0A3Q3JD44_MONAL|nr:uncharacterized protein C11orf57 homolog isoform X1 [Monopterus albus]XP_020470529.1 uncharacterized protein C11orf57 homolog isoform X1 [Monopterus albus]XP_020470530.1 uncharacterized protein C11orf57 homolog isoform X1 [Monopterus albus]XP_020470531.1 uncharacterized protein C11orf57 homolog isoform X1 [Monopterus albus]